MKAFLFVTYVPMKEKRSKVMKGNMYRTYKCSELREKHVGEEIKLAGWVDTIRDLGGVLFIDLRDQYGVTQVVVSGDEEKVDFAAKIPTESTISVLGKVRLRDEETINLKLETGTVELFADKTEFKIVYKNHEYCSIFIKKI